MTRSPQSRPTAVRVRAHAPDYLLLTVVIVLSIIGLIAVYSSSYVLGEAQFGDANYFVKRQMVFLVMGLVLMFMAMRFPYRALMRLSPLLMLGALILLALVLVPGVGMEQNGAYRWISLPAPLPPLQPSEVAKLAVLIYMAAWLAAKGDLLHDVSLGVLPFVGMVGIISALIILEPDLGTAIMVAGITGVLFFVAGARLFHVIVLAATGLVTVVLLTLAGGYRMDRVTAFLDAESDPSGVGFHALQLLVAFGSGGFTGVGLGVSRQKFFYVPGSHTDGVLAIIGEELGYIGIAVVMGLFVVLLWRGLMIARRADTQFGSLIAMGVLAWIAFQMLINVGGVTRLLPLTGIPLPFLSYGGSALLSIFIGMGVLLSVSRYTALPDSEAEPASGSLRRAPAPRRPATTSGGAR
ncbi:MAG: putative lipid II flippase FtsW [Chloroflexi bacterium]|nr:putative lipid II flippase FtsW [Chloroflexota bacterium]MDA1240715.1 putative lipid II flippase FtsW [Chloroflexota bacterium]MQC25634.1 putative lipid II flippase FtsW [Chloroflexota bacterium]MQC47974.1 putative lipid II flippase FtsW [Chloroflexota bacterium]